MKQTVAQKRLAKLRTRDIRVTVMRMIHPDTGEPYRWPGEHVDSRGRIAGREVRCISPELQLRWHEHEDFDDVDWADMGVLAGRFGLPTPGPRPGFISARRAGDKKSQPRHEG